MSVTLIDPTQLKNGSGPAASGGFIFAANYDFPAQTPGGSLIVGSNTITLHPVPAGVNGSDSNHYVYISGGTGTAEAVLITGGTAVSGTSSGTITFTCAHTHSGAWTVKSATGGIQEAINTAVDGSTVVISAGSINVYASIRVDKAIAFLGANSFVRLIGVPSNLKFFNCVASFCTWDGIYFADASGDQTAGGCGIYLDSATNNQGAIIRNCHFSRLYDCITGVKALYYTISENVFDSFLHNAITIADTASPDGGGPMVFNNLIVKLFNPGVIANAAIEIQSTGGMKVIGNSIGGAINYGILISSVVSSGCIISSNDIENVQLYSINLQGVYSRVVVTGNTVSQFAGIGDPVTWDGILFSGTADSVVIEGNAVQGTGAATNVGVNVQGIVSRAMIGDNQIGDCGYGIYSTATTVNTSIGINNIINCIIPLTANSTSVILSLSCNQTFAQISALVCSDGSMLYCTDGHATSPTDNTLVGGGSGALGVRIASVWRAVSATGGAIPLTITGTQDGSNTAFTASGNVGQLFRNGLLLAPTIDYTAVGVAITMVIAPAGPDVLLAFST